VAIQRWLSVKQAADVLGEGVHTVYRLVKARRLTVRRGGVSGRSVLIEAASVEALLRATTTVADVAASVMPKRRYKWPTPSTFVEYLDQEHRKQSGQPP
jgi:excisionase family DNA binding protein